ncbi:unnamed protein product [Closterium sp. NIES-64]|nr:unnamed protein product [Closterium sp. NIES-64]
MRTKYEKMASAIEEKRRATSAAVAAVQAGGGKRRITNYLEGDASAAKRDAHEGLALMFATCRIPEVTMDHPLFINAMLLVNRGGNGYVPPRRTFIGGAGLVAVRKGIEQGLVGIKSSWKKTGVTIASDMMTDKCGRAQANVLLINDSGAVFREAIDCEFFCKLMQLPYKAMRQTDADANEMMGRLYNVMPQLTEDVNNILDEDEQQLSSADKEKIRSIIKDRWDNNLACAMHVAGRILNPTDQEEDIFGSDAECIRIFKALIN